MIQADTIDLLTEQMAHFCSRVHALDKRPFRYDPAFERDPNLPYVSVLEWPDPNDGMPRGYPPGRFWRKG